MDKKLLLEITLKTLKNETQPSSPADSQTHDELWGFVFKIIETMEVPK